MRPSGPMTSRIIQEVGTPAAFGLNNIHSGFWERRLGGDSKAAASTAQMGNGIAALLGMPGLSFVMVFICF